MEKEERIAMWVRRFIFFICLCSLPMLSHSQVKRSWSFMLAPGVSHSKLPHGFGIGYPDSPFYVNLKLREPHLFAYRAEVGQEKINRKGWFFSKALGFSTYHYIVYYDYDREASIGNNLSDRYDFNFIYGSYQIGRPFQFDKLTITPYAGVGLNYLIKAKYTYTSVYGDVEYNHLSEYERWTFGWELGSKFTYQLNDNIGFELRPSYNKIQAKYFRGERMVYSYTLGLAVIKKFKK